jgi:hypothetical protein
MIPSRRPTRSVAMMLVFAGSMAAAFVRAAEGEIHLSVHTSDAAMFNQKVTVDSEFRGFLSDTLSLPDGSFRIMVTGPGNAPDRTLYPRFFYGIATVQVDQSRPSVTAFMFRSMETCGPQEKRVVVTEWQAPVIVSEKGVAGVFRLELPTPLFGAPDGPCNPPPHPLLARWREIGVLKLHASSDPDNAEVWIRGVLAGKTNGTFNVPYASSGQVINVTVRMPGRVNCNWKLPGPHGAEANVRCDGKAPGVH